MLSYPILLIGGAGMVGKETARYLRAAYPDAQILIGGRNIAKARQAATEIGDAEAVTIDLTTDDLGLGIRQVCAVVPFFADASLSVMRFAQAHGVPLIGISTPLHAIAPEVASFVHKPNASAIVLGTEWLVGAATVPALRFARDFGRIDTVRIGALIDELDTGGPEQSLDYERAQIFRPPVLSRRNGEYIWRAGEETGGTFRSADGTELEGVAMPMVDVVGLATETGALNVEFNLAVSVSSTRRQGGALSTEIIIEMTGQDTTGAPLRTRHAVIYPSELLLTALGVAMLLERLIGLDGKPAVPPGLYFPYQVLDHDAYLSRLRQEGGQILQLEVL